MLQQIATVTHTGTASSGEAALGVAVLSMSISDLQRGKPQSREWFDSSAFTFWLAAIGGDLDPDILRDAIFKRFDGDTRSKVYACANEKQRAVVEALRDDPEARSCDLARQIGVSEQTIRKYRRILRTDPAQLELF